MFYEFIKTLYHFQQKSLRAYNVKENIWTVDPTQSDDTFPWRANVFIA